LPASFSDIKRAAQEFGIAAEKPTRGSHWKLRDVTGKAYPLPCPNGERSELSDVYIKGLCRAFGLDLDDFKRRL